VSFAVRSIAGPELRYERKFVVPAVGASGIEALLRRHPARFVEVYAPRCVNSIYFDTLTLRHYFDGIDGEANRRKYRLRWYGDLFAAPETMQLEIKRKHGHVGSKLLHPVRGFEFKRGLSGREIERAFAPLWSGETDQRLEPVLLVRYARRYFVSRDQRFRITVDHGVEYHRIARVGNTFRRPLRPDANRIVELKYATADDDSAGSVAAAVPYRASRHSKYCTGVDRLYPHRSGVGID
jgi:hypothetical protein